jgi:hypothetical protein
MINPFLLMVADQFGEGQLQLDVFEVIGEGLAR